MSGTQSRKTPKNAFQKQPEAPAAMHGGDRHSSDRVDTLAFDRFTVDLRRRALYRDGQRVHLTTKPLETLIVLLQRPGQTVDKLEILDTVWKDIAVTEDVLVQAVGEIRRALGERAGEDRFVQTVPRQGYRFVMPVVAIAAPDGPRTATIAQRAWLAPALLAVASIVAISAWLALAPAFSTNRSSASASPGPAAPTRLVNVSTLGTIHAGGVVAEIEGDANGNAQATLEWRTEGTAFRPGHPLVRIDARRFVGSLFWLTPLTEYTVRVTLVDPDGGSRSQIVESALHTEADAWPEPSLSVLHVSPSGRDTNSGTSPETPLRTIQRAADLARPGDVVLIQPGVYRESVRVRKSGTRLQPLVFRGAGPGVILDGADARVAAGVAWTPLGGGLFEHDTGFATTHVTTELGRLFRYASLKDLRTLRVGAPGGFFAETGHIYMKFADNSAPSRHTIHAGRLDRGILVDRQSWVGFDNLEIRHYGGAETGVGIELRECTSCRIWRCRFSEIARAGIWADGGQGGRIEDNAISDTSITSWPWHDVNLSHTVNHGIFFGRPAPRGFVVRHNFVDGTVDGIAPCGSASPAGGPTNETDVYDNVLGDVADDAIEAESYCANVRLWGNRINGSLMAISTAPAAPGPTWILRNIAYGFGKARGHEVWSASGLKINTFDKVSSGAVFLYHNTFVTDIPRVDAIALLEPGEVALVRARNNVLAGTRHALQKTNPLYWDGDGNDLYTSSSESLVEWLGVQYRDVEAFRRATGQERGGFSAAPLLVDPLGGDFTPKSGSPLVDRGLPIPGINDGFRGRAPDVGAIETGSPPGRTP
jgi:DNA-binding winged helix-turn-helix (wHTH) protein